ncbi:MAG: hypothetical protein BWK76_13640 [Desulfobulbaceae bacterium A2]|nr:MAG: hypothetical protein BWK76_13640 [Desulfobulbaceae bacterium A2]
MTKIIRLTGAIFLLPSLSLMPELAAGAGFAILQQGTGPMGQGNAFVAQADDPSAIFFNPAGITQLEGTQGYLGTTLIAPRNSYDGLDGSSDDTVAKLYAVPQLYLTHKLNPAVSLGFGIFSPFGLGTAWDDNWAGRYLTTSSSLSTVTANPNVAVRLGKFSVAAGVDILRADLELKKNLLTPYGDGTQELSDTTWGYGYNLGLLYDATDTVKLGLSYRSKIDLDFDSAEAKFAVPSALTRYFPTTSGHGELVLPPSLTAGASYSPRRDLTLECDVTWTGWSSYDELALYFDSPVGPRATTSSVQPKNWEDVLAYRLGLRYRLNAANTLRLGVIFDENPVPDATLGPDLPDADRLIYTVGYDYLLNERMTLGIAYNYIDGKTRSKANDVTPDLPVAYRALGSYEQSTHSLGLSLKYSF